MSMPTHIPDQAKLSELAHLAQLTQLTPLTLPVHKANDYFASLQSVNFARGLTGLTKVVPVEKVFTHGDYEVVVLLSSDGKFMGISEIRMRREFMNIAQRTAAARSINLDQFYNNEEE